LLIVLFDRYKAKGIRSRAETHNLKPRTQHPIVFFLLVCIFYPNMSMNGF
jgi:hypothetical protein